MKRKAIGFFVLLFSVAAAFGARAIFRPPTPRGAPVGRASAIARIVDDNGAPWANAAVFSEYVDAEAAPMHVRIVERRQATDADGSIEIPFFLDDGRIFSDAWMEDGERIGARLGDGSGRTTVVLPRPSGAFDLKIYGPEGQPIAGATVRYGPRDRTSARTTDASGVVRLARTNPRSPDLTIEREDKTVVTFVGLARSIEKSTDPSMTVNWPSTGRLIGRFAGPESGLACGWTVTARTASDADDDGRIEAHALAVVDASGRFTFPSLPVGRWTLSATLPADARVLPSVTATAETFFPGGPPEESIVVREDAEATAIIPLGRSRPIAGRVIDSATKAPIPNAVVYAFRRSGTLTAIVRADADDQGRFRSVAGEDPKEPFLAALDAESPMFALAIDPTLGANGESFDIEWTPPGRREVHGVVIDPDDRPVAGAYVRVSEVIGLVDKTMGIGRNAVATRTNARGEFRVHVSFSSARRIVARFGTLAAEFEDSWRYSPGENEPVVLPLKERR